MSRLVCVGDLNADITIEPDGPIHAGTDTPGHVGLAAGGSAANVAAEAARLGTPVRFAGVVGDDALGHLLVDDLAALGIEVRAVERENSASRAIAALIDDDGDRAMVSDLTTATALAAADVDSRWLADTAWLHLTAYTWFPDVGPGAWDRLLAIAADHGVPWSIDPSSARMLASVRGVSAAAAAFAGASVVFPSLDEAAVLSGTDDAPAAAGRLLELAETVVVTLGAHGVVVARRGVDPFAVDAHPSRVVNSLGCGDALVAGFLSGRLAGLDDRTCTERGLMSAARVLARPTAR